jgi:hypothetical protein
MRFFCSVVSFLGLVGVVSGCTLPAAQVRAARLPAGIDFVALCGSHNAPRSTLGTCVLEREGEPVTAVLECSSARAVLVILNSLGVRVRTMQIDPSGSVRDEVSYLASPAVASEGVLEAVLQALPAPQPAPGNTPYK